MKNNFGFSLTGKKFLPIWIMFLLCFALPYLALIKWQMNHIKEGSSALIVLGVFLFMLTIGIYAPLAILKLYKYFAERTTAVDTASNIRFGYDIDPFNDFLFLWRQILLTVVTLSVYYPWCYCKIRARILSKTYLIRE